MEILLQTWAVFFPCCYTSTLLLQPNQNFPLASLGSALNPNRLLQTPKPSITASIMNERGTRYSIIVQQLWDQESKQGSRLHYFQLLGSSERCKHLSLWHTNTKTWAQLFPTILGFLLFLFYKMFCVKTDYRNYILITTGHLNT